MTSRSDRFVSSNRRPGPGDFGTPIKAVVLDWAGTTVDFGSCAPAATFVEAFARHGAAVTLTEARAPMGMAKRAHIAAIAAAVGVAESWHRAHGRGFVETDIDAIYATFLPLQEACIDRFSTVIPGAVETAAELRSCGIRIGSSTGYTREITARVMRSAKEQGFEVEEMLCSSDFAQGRPWPWMIFENMRRLEVFPPAAVVTVDDTLVGIEAARNAGTWAVGIAATGNLVGLGRDEFESLPDRERVERVEAARAALIEAGADYVVDSIGDLPAVLDDIKYAIPF